MYPYRTWNMLHETHIDRPKENAETQIAAGKINEAIKGFATMKYLLKFLRQ